MEIPFKKKKIKNILDMVEKDMITPGVTLGEGFLLI